MPSLLLIVIVIGGIVSGIFTATEGAGNAELYCLILSNVYKSITIKDDPEALRFTRQCLEADQRGARKSKEVTDDGGVVSAYYQLPGKDPDVNRFVLFKVNSKGTITLVYIEGELDSDDLITLLFTKKDL